MRAVMQRMDNELYMYDGAEADEEKQKLSHIPTDAINLDSVVMKNLLDSFISENKLEPGPASLLFQQVGEKFEKYFGYLARCEGKFCTTTLKN